uniref:Uncharacterized protein n=1 Tax=Lepeophtheirus salmonis TaxID=72036 RepID=A0A0K2UW82_LEPSM
MEADISEKVFSYIGIKDYEKLSLLLFEEVSLSPEKLNFPDWHFGSGSIPIIQTVINEDIDSCRVLLEVGVSPNVQDIQGKLYKTLFTMHLLVLRLGHRSMIFRVRAKGIFSRPV